MKENQSDRGKLLEACNVSTLFQSRMVKTETIAYTNKGI